VLGAGHREPGDVVEEQRGRVVAVEAIELRTGTVDAHPPQGPRATRRRPGLPAPFSTVPTGYRRQPTQSKEETMFEHFDTPQEAYNYELADVAAVTPRRA
jgi:hypothetical protein